MKCVSKYKRMITTIAIFLTITLGSFTPVLSQTNGVRQNLIQCYNASYLPEVLTPNGRPPATVNILIEYIRRLEDSNPTVTSRELSALLMQRLRQDGIMATRVDTDIRFGIPFSPKRLEAHKSTLILQRFLTNVTLDLNFGDLDPVEVCSLHYLLSSTIDNRVRRDEGTTCSRASRYTSRIFRRRRDEEAVAPEDPETEIPETPEDDQNNDETPNVEVEVEGVEGFGTRSIVGSTTDISQCPIELGVLYTNHGTVKASQVLVGIATGFNSETVNGIDNRYAATIAGELAEAALVQARENIVVGVSGGWNSTVNPRYYFLQRNTQLQTTDAEIRGSLDGLYIALTLDNWRSRFSDLKISQILDLYYSPYQRGVFDESFRACNRNILYTELVASETMRSQVAAIIGPLDDASQYGQTVASSAFETLTDAAIQSFNSYLPQMSTRDLACRPDDSSIERVNADLLIFIDARWNYLTTQSVLAYVLDNIDVNRFGTRYTIMSGLDGTNVTSSSTSYLLDFHKQYNLTVHQGLTNGFSYTTVYQIIEDYARAKLNNNSYSSGESIVSLLIPRSTPTTTDNVFLEQRREIFRQELPDVTILVAGSGTQSDYRFVVNTPGKEVLILQESNNEDTLSRMGQSIVDMIRNVPRSIINPNCGSTFSGASSTFSVTDFVEPRGVNYYRISPNYFFTGDGTRNLRITENSYGSVDVCISRDQSRPNNQTGDCETLRSQVRTIDISNYCGGTVTGCSPIFISVAANTTQTRCTDTTCRFPDNVKFTITMENVGCASSAIRMLSNSIVVIVLYLILSF